MVHSNLTAFKDAYRFAITILPVRRLYKKPEDRQGMIKTVSFSITGC